MTNYQLRITKLCVDWRTVLLFSVSFLLLVGCVARSSGSTDAPLRRVVCMSSSHVAFIDALGCADRIVGISGVRYITSPNVQGVPEVGYEGNLDYELVARLKPDAVLTYSVAGERVAALDRLEELGIRVIEIGEHLETTPLDKAAWIVTFGELLGERERAEAIFDSVREEYEAVRELAADVADRPRVMLTAPGRDAWFVPGDESYFVALLHDAGAAYACAGTSGNRSRAIGFETAWRTMSRSDYWLHPNEATSLGQLDARLADTPPVAAGRVYNNNLRSTAGGGSDFWESGAVYPDRVLRDLIAIFHPEILPNHELYYYRKLE